MDSTGPMAVTAVELQTRIQGLAQELRDMIFECIVLDDSPEDIKITKDYRPPVQMQLNKATRDTFAKKYYSRHTFIITWTSNEPFNLSESFYIRWLKSLNIAHARLIKELLVVLHNVKLSPEMQATLRDRGESIEEAIALRQFRCQIEHVMQRGLLPRPRNFEVEWAHYI